MSGICQGKRGIFGQKPLLFCAYCAILNTIKGQFGTILSENKTMEKGWAVADPFFCCRQPPSKGKDLALQKPTVMTRLKRKKEELCCLLASVPPVFLCFFVLSLFAMNLLAHKSLGFSVSWFAMDAGFLVSWAVFLALDVFTKHFGPRAATALSVFALLLHLLFCAIFFLAGLLPGVWSAASGETGGAVNEALNRTFGGTWYVLLGSAVAFLAAAVVNNFMHFIALGLFKKRDGLVAFAVSGVISTALGQFVDNLVFALLVSHLFFGWTLVQCVSCALAGVVIELLCELLFLGLGHRVCRAWKERGVGEAYFRLCQQNRRERE